MPLLLITTYRELQTGYIKNVCFNLNFDQWLSSLIFFLEIHKDMEWLITIFKRSYNLTFLSIKRNRVVLIDYPIDCSVKKAFYGSLFQSLWPGITQSYFRNFQNFIELHRLNDNLSLGSSWYFFVYNLNLLTNYTYNMMAFVTST